MEKVFIVYNYLNFILDITSVFCKFLTTSTLLNIPQIKNKLTWFYIYQTHINTNRNPEMTVLWSSDTNFKHVTMYKSKFDIIRFE